VFNPLRLALKSGTTSPPIFLGENNMKKESKKTNEAQLLDLLKRVLPKATTDSQLAGKIYEAIEAELKAKARVLAFEKFCSKVELPDLEAKTVDDVKLQLAASFGDGDITIQPNKKEKTLSVEVAMPDGSQFNSEIKVGPVAAADSDEQEITLKFIPFPVSLPGDKELVWLLAKLWWSRVFQHLTIRKAIVLEPDSLLIPYGTRYW